MNTQAISTQTVSLTPPASEEVPRHLAARFQDELQKSLPETESQAWGGMPLDSKKESGSEFLVRTRSESMTTSSAHDSREEGPSASAPSDLRSEARVDSAEDERGHRDLRDNLESRVSEKDAAHVDSTARQEKEEEPEDLKKDKRGTEVHAGKAELAHGQVVVPHSVVPVHHADHPQSATGQKPAGPVANLSLGSGAVQRAKNPWGKDAVADPAEAKLKEPGKGEAKIPTRAQTEKGKLIQNALNAQIVVGLSESKIATAEATDKSTAGAESGKIADKKKLPVGTPAPVVESKTNSEVKPAIAALAQGLESARPAAKSEERRPVAKPTAEPGLSVKSAEATAVSVQALPAAQESASTSKEKGFGQDGQPREGALGMSRTASEKTRTSEALASAAPRLDELARQVAAQVRSAVVNGRAEMTVHLDPMDLGRMTIELKRESDGTLSGKLMVENEAVREQLGQALVELKDNLRLLGHEFSQLTLDAFASQSGASQSQGGDSAPSPREGRPVALGNAEVPSDLSGFSAIDIRYQDRIVNLVA